MTSPEENKTPAELEQLVELIEALLIARATTGNTPEIEAQLTGLLLRQDDIQQRFGAV